MICFVGGFITSRVLRPSKYAYPAFCATRSASCRSLVPHSTALLNASTYKLCCASTNSAIDLKFNNPPGPRTAKLKLRSRSAEVADVLAG